MVLGFCLVCDPGEGVEGCCPAFLGIVKDGTLDPELLAACMRPACAAGSLSSFCGGFCPKTAQLSIPAQTRCEETPRHTLALLDSTAAECAFTANVRVRPLFLGSAVASQFTLMPCYKCQHLLDHHSLGFCRRNDTEAAKRLIEQAHLRRPVLDWTGRLHNSTHLSLVSGSESLLRRPAAVARCCQTCQERRPRECTRHPTRHVKRWSPLIWAASHGNEERRCRKPCDKSSPEAGSWVPVRLRTSRDY